MYCSKNRKHLVASCMRTVKWERNHSGLYVVCYQANVCSVGTMSHVVWRKSRGWCCFTSWIVINLSIFFFVLAGEGFGTDSNDILKCKCINTWHQVANLKRNFEFFKSFPRKNNLLHGWYKESSILQIKENILGYMQLPWQLYLK